MCKMCRRYKCPPTCPAFVGESAELGKRMLKCALCGGAIYENDRYTVYYGKPYCERCVEVGKTDKRCEERLGDGSEVYDN